MAARRPPDLIKSPEVKDNETNQLTEEHVPSAINMVLATPVQSYEQFMDSFVYLKRDDVDEYLPELEKYPEENVFERRLKETGDAEQLEAGEIEIIKTSPTEETDKDDLETEELAEGDNSLTTPRQRLPQQKYVKIDNFVEEMSSDEDDSDDPSFEDISDLLEESVSTDSSPRIDAKRVSIEIEDEEKVSIEIKDEEKELGDDGSQDRSSLDSIPKLPSPLPGESDPTLECTLETNVEIRETRLSFGNREGDPAFAEAEELQSDEVQPFSLDPDFDYDNVKLTPKWGQTPFFSPEPS